MKGKNIIFGVVSYAGAFLFVTAIFLIIFPNGFDDESLKVRFFWAHFLVFLVWFVNIGALLIGFDDKRQLFGLAGLLPGAGIVTIFYASLSFMIMVLASFVEPTGFLNRFHLLIQVTAIFGYFLILLIFFISFEGARAGQDWNSGEGKTTIHTLESNLGLIESVLIESYRSDNLKSIKLKRILASLRSKVSSSLPNSGRQLSKPEYIDFLNELDQLIVNKIDIYKNLRSDEFINEDFFYQVEVFLGEIGFKLDVAIKKYRS